MSRNRFVAAVATLIVVVAVLAVPVAGRAAEPSISAGSDAVLTVLYPTTGTIKSLIALRAQGLLPSQGLRVVGVYHQQQETDFGPSQRMIDAEGLSWITLRAVTAPLERASIYGRNAMTEELASIVADSDGILFYGGADIPPELFGAKKRFLSVIETPYRHYFELSLIFHLLGGSQDEGFRALLEDDPDLPVIGFCLGEQSLNVGTGGTLVQDIWSEVYGLDTADDVLALPEETWHRNPYRELHPEEGLTAPFMHHVRLLPEGKLVAGIGGDAATTPLVYSSHHQAVGKLGKDLRIAATSMDGKVVEAVEHVRYPNVLGVQFHPETPRLWDPDAEVKFRPGGETVKLHEVLTGDPDSLGFHRKLWAWITARVQAHHASRS